MTVSHLSLNWKAEKKHQGVLLVVYFSQAGRLVEFS